MTGTASDFGGRLRLGEEKYCEKYSTPFKQPFQRVLDSISKETKETLSNPHMMVSEVQARLLKELVALMRPTRVLEIGGFTGYSAVAMASALQPNTKIVSLELDPKHIEIAKRQISSAGLQDKIEFIQGPANESLLNLAGTQYDFIFLGKSMCVYVCVYMLDTSLDADKGGYIHYFDTIMEHHLLSDQGVLIVDNVLYFGQVHKSIPGFSHENEPVTTEASKNIKKVASKVHKFNEHIANDTRVESTILPIFDGITIIRKK
ncbi:hypothetical protein CU098_006944 [Rhizopus stolonifer]|uniref:O-methyltransferase n=2 Tax=Mucorineae TaxID=1344963 RepID=A0A367IRY4_RHIST|nr:hypothetical protein CU098_006944 [Rhizopus stolonifer]